MKSTIFDWDKIPAMLTKTGSRRAFFSSPTGTLDQLSCHATTLNPGEAAHPPHQHPDEEMIILKEGTLDAIHNGTTLPMTPGSILFLSPNDLHWVRNSGTTQATYYVIKWFSPGMMPEK